MSVTRSKLPDSDVLPSPWVRRFDVQGGLLLLDRASNTLLAYNDVARCIWDLIEAGRSEPEAVAAIAERWGIPASLAQDDIRSILALWRTQGLLAGDAELPADRGSGSGSEPVALPSVAPDDWVCTIHKTAIAFTMAAELLAPVRALFSHLETPGAVVQSRMMIARTPSGEFVLVEDGQERLRTDETAIAVGALYVAVLERIRPGLQWFALMHGAALVRHGHGFALIGSTGSGKSTLAAGLMAAGFDYLADDLVALAQPDAAIVPWPLPISVKPGSLDILASRYPDLAQAARYQTKNIEARLLLPDADAWDTPPVKLKTLIFPRFIAGTTPQTRRLSPFEALERLLTDRVWLGDPITEERVTAFLAWLDDTPAYALSYGTLDDAVGLVESVIR